MRFKACSLIGIAVLLASGCDPVYKTPIQNAYGYDVSVTIYYSDGRMERMIWLACTSQMIGRPSVSIDKILIEKGNKILLTLSSGDIESLKEKFSQVHGAANILVGSSGVGVTAIKPDRESDCSRSR